jgi:hypothetical protein
VGSVGACIFSPPSIEPHLGTGGCLVCIQNPVEVAAWMEIIGKILSPHRFKTVAVMDALISALSIHIVKLHILNQVYVTLRLEVIFSDWPLISAQALPNFIFQV